MPWRQRHPGRYEYELEELVARGLEFVPDLAFARRSGLVGLRGSVVWRDEKVDMLVVLPQTFPYMRPEVYAPNLSRNRHQNPFGGRNLCLLDRSTAQWRPSDTVAWLITEQLPYLLDLLEEGGDALTEAESPQGEPISAFFQWRPGTSVFVPTEALALDSPIQSGVAQLRLESAEQTEDHFLLRAILDRISHRDGKGRVHALARADRTLAAHFTGSTIPARWARLTKPPAGPDAEAILAAASAVEASLGTPVWQSHLGFKIDVVGVVFQEEVTQGEHADAWLFAVRFEKPNAGPGSYVTHGQRLTEEDLLARIPALAGLRGKTAAVAGLGALGAPIVIELAKAQVGRLRVLDHDRVEVGTTVRWPIGLPAVGHDKVPFLSEHVGRNFPFTEVVPIPLRIGQAEPPTGRPEMELLDALLTGADLLIDATAEIGIQHLLSNLAGTRGMKQLYVWGTEGGFGGVVARVSPGETGCWMCLQYRFEDGSIPLPPLEATGTVQPRGCATRTFTGTGFDMLPLVAQAVRVAVQTLLHDEPDGYPENGHDVFVVSIRTEAGSLPAPRWESFQLDPHPSCSECKPTGG